MLLIQFQHLMPMVLGNKVASFLDSQYIYYALMLFNSIHSVCCFKCGGVIIDFIPLTKLFPQFAACVNIYTVSNIMCVDTCKRLATQTPSLMYAPCV